MVLGPLAVVYRTHAQADGLADEVVQAASAAQRAAVLRNEVEARAAAAAFMPKHQRWPRAIEVLDALTKALPDDTWIFRLEMRPGLVMVAGFSSNVPALLERLTASPLATPELTSPVVHGVANTKDRFELRVQLKASEP
jgi:general secretion pathway protein L